MIVILPLHPKLKQIIKKHQLTKKVQKQLKLLQANPQHPSLKVELLEPKQYGIYSLRLDRKYRAIFIFRPDKQVVETLNITLHYR